MASSSAIQLARDANIPMQSYPPPVGPPPAHNSGSAEDRSGIHLTRDADFLIQSFLPGAESRPAFEIPGLPLPYCAPQLTTGFDAPFARGYSPTLKSVDLTRDQLLAFVDGLNLAMTASPPLRVVNLAGMVIGFVPYHWAMIAGAAIQAGAKTGMRVLSKTLTDRYLRAANLRLFKPRGLSVRMCTTAAMRHLVMRTPITAAPSKLKRFGRGVGSVLLRVPLPTVNMAVHLVADKPPKIAATDPAGRNKKLLATRRRVAALEGYALPLDFDMPRPAKAQGVMDTMAGWGVKFDSWLDGRRQTKAEDARLKLEELEEQEREGRDTVGHTQGARGGLLMGDGGGRRLGRLGGGRLGGGSGGLLMGGGGGRGLGGLGGGGLVGALVARVGDRSGRTEPSSGSRSQAGGIMGIVGQTRIGGLLQGGGRTDGVLLARGGKGELERKVADADLIEHWQADKLLWVVIMNSEIDDEIEGIELAESNEDEERIDAEMWQEEMNMERQERQNDVEVERLAAQNSKAGGE